MNSKDKEFDWQKAMTTDLEIAEIHFARRISRGSTTVDDALEYLVCRGWDLEKAKKALNVG